MGVESKRAESALTEQPQTIAQIKLKRKEDAMAMAKLAYDVFKEKKRREKSIIINGQNNAKQPSSNRIY